MTMKLAHIVMKLDTAHPIAEDKTEMKYIRTSVGN
jgi:hypothetical protein